MATQKVTLVSYPRSGSTLLIDALGQFANVLAVMEPFHELEHIIVEHLQLSLGAKAEVLIEEIRKTQGSLLDFVQREPTKYLAMVSAAMESEYFVYKVFPEHLAEASLEQTIADSALVLVLSRNVLHGFISNCMALKKNTFAFLNTSDDFITFDFKNFREWSNPIFSYFDSVKKMAKAHSVPTLTIHYEDLLAESNSLEKFLVSHLRGYGVKLKPPKTFVARYPRQDARRWAEDKVNNPKYMMKKLNEFGLLALNDGNESMAELKYIKPYPATFTGWIRRARGVFGSHLEDESV